MAAGWISILAHIFEGFGCVIGKLGRAKNQIGQRPIKPPFLQNLGLNPEKFGFDRGGAANAPQ